MRQHGNRDPAFVIGRYIIKMSYLKIDAVLI